MPRVRYVGRLATLNAPGYTELDAGVHLGMRVRVSRCPSSDRTSLMRTTLSRTLRSPGSGLSTEVQRGVYGRVTWQF